MRATRRALLAASLFSAALIAGLILWASQKVSDLPAHEALRVTVQPEEEGFFLDEELSCLVEITNTTDIPCYIVKHKDGSTGGHRYPWYTFTFLDEEGRELARRREVLCDSHFNTLRKEDFVLLRPGDTFAQTIKAGYLRNEEHRPRTARVVVTYEMGDDPNEGWSPLGPHEWGATRLWRKAVQGKVSSGPVPVRLKQRPMSYLHDLLDQAGRGDVNALVHLEENKAAQLVSEIIQLLQATEEHSVKFYAIRCLGVIGDRRAREAVRQFIVEGDEELERIAITSAARLGDVEAKDRIFAAYMRIVEEGHDRRRKIPYLVALVRLDDERVVHDIRKTSLVDYYRRLGRPDIASELDTFVSRHSTGD